jgi:hypothetical protein
MTHTPNTVGFNTPWKGGFHITFENGYTVSVQFGYGNYCEHHFKLDEMTKRIKDVGRDSTESEQMNSIHYAGPSSDAEVAIWDRYGKWVPMPDWDDVVKGYLTPTDVLKIFNHVASLPEVK